MLQVQYGELVPVGGGDSIPLYNTTITVGRRDICDVALKFQNVSGMHCEFTFMDGYWLVRDLGSSNGIKINGERSTRRPLKPGDEVSIATHRFVIQYTLGIGNKLSEALAEEDDLFGQSLMEKAGLEKPKKPSSRE